MIDSWEGNSGVWAPRRLLASASAVMIRGSPNTGFAFGSGRIPANFPTFWLRPNSSGKLNGRGPNSSGTQHLSPRFNGHFPGEPGLAGVYWSKGWWRWWWKLDNWSYNSCKAPVKSSPTTNQHPVFYRPDFRHTAYYCFINGPKYLLQASRIIPETIYAYKSRVISNKHYIKS